MRILLALIALKYDIKPLKGPVTLSSLSDTLILPMDEKMGFKRRQRTVGGLRRASSYISKRRDVKRSTGWGIWTLVA